MPPIKVSDKALAHLSRGLYRSPASALKELVSNAWDANAKRVRISTNYPNFLQLACLDDGDGFSREEFTVLMGGGIGNSLKRVQPPVLINNRPVIGRLGIGMLSIAQMCGAFTVTSRPKRGKPFRARVTLYDLLRERLDKPDTEVVKTAPEIVGTDGAQDAVEMVREVDIGKYEFLQLESDDLPLGTSIIADDLHPSFVKAFQDSLTGPNFKEPNLKWPISVRRFYEVTSLRELGDYWRLLWEMSVATPIPYLLPNALPEAVIKDEHKRLLSYDLTVIVDGITLRKPVRLRGNPEGYTVVKFPPQAQSVYGRPLRFDGYLVVQEGREIKPAELRGILIRINNVAIGYYDSTLLDYRINEGPRSRWVTGEVFVREGLENALNIDRDSFNQFHPEFRVVQEFVHSQAKTRLFAEVYKKIAERSERRSHQRDVDRRNALKATLTEELGARVTIGGSAGAQATGTPSSVQVHAAKRKLTVVLPPEESVRTKKANRNLAVAILTIFETAMQQKHDTDRRSLFRRLLFRLLRNW